MLTSEPQSFCATSSKVASLDILSLSCMWGNFNSVLWVARIKWDNVWEVSYTVYDIGRHSIMMASNNVFIHSESRMGFLDVTANF